MIKLKDLLKEAEDKKTPIIDQADVTAAVMDFFDKNKKAFEKLADDEEWDDFYDKAFEKFPEADQDDVAQALNKAAMRAGFFENEEVAEMPEEKELEDMAFGDKSQQKGVNMGDYDKKNKLPKASSTDLTIPIKEDMTKSDWIVGQEIIGTKKHFFLYNQKTGKRKGMYKSKQEAEKANITAESKKK
jgi:phage terminase large subunit-like protein